MSRTLLYIDPDPAIRLLVRKVLVPAGFHVLDAENAASGRRLAEGTKPDVVLVDVDATEVAAADLARALRKSPDLERAVLIASTAEDDPAHLQKTSAGGFEAVLVKPLDIEALVRELEAYVPPADGDVREPTTSPKARSRRGVPTWPRWRRNLVPLIEKLVNHASVADGRLALLDQGEAALVLVAGYSHRPAGASPPIGLKIPLSSVAWLQSFIDARQPVVIDPEKFDASPLLPPASTAVLVVPLVTDDATYGTLILGERRRRTFAFPPAQVDEILREAARITAVLREFDHLDEAITEKRRAVEQFVEQFRTEVTQQVAAAGREVDPACAVEHEAWLRLNLRLAERLSLPAEETDILRQAIKVHDVGRTWIEHALLPHMDLTAPDRLVVLGSQADQTAEMLSALGWSPAVVETIRAYRQCLQGDGTTGSSTIPMAARLMAATAAYREAVRTHGADAEGKSRGRALEDLMRSSGQRLDPLVVKALTDLLGEESSSAS